MEQNENDFEKIEPTSKGIDLIKFDEDTNDGKLLNIYALLLELNENIEVRNRYLFENESRLFITKIMFYILYVLLLSATVIMQFIR